jgi:large subunit ribosomal protein L6
MSRIGKQPVVLPSGVKADMEAGDLVVSGPKGNLRQNVDSRISVAVDTSEVKFARESNDPQERALHGLYRALCQNMVDGVTKGFQKRLEVHGVGYTSQIQGNALSVSVGFSHPVVFPIPSGLNVTCPNNTTIDVDGIDKQMVGQFAAQVRACRPSEPYKGKGIRYAGEQIKRKAGKSMASGG